MSERAQEIRERVEKFGEWLNERCDRSLERDGVSKVTDAFCEVREKFRSDVRAAALLDRLQAAEERVEQMRSALQKIRFWSSPENDEATEGDTVAKMWHAARKALREGEG